MLTVVLLLSFIQKQLCFGLALKGGRKKLRYFMASQKHSRDCWISGLRYVIHLDRFQQEQYKMDRY